MTVEIVELLCPYALAVEFASVGAVCTRDKLYCCNARKPGLWVECRIKTVADVLEQKKEKALGASAKS